MIPKHIIDQIFETARIEEVIGEFVNLKKSGQNFKALSPFTDEKTPSFFVSPSKQIFKDFSSGKGGNVVGFLMEHEHYSYPEALRFLAEKYNIEIPEDKEVTEEEKEAQNERESLYIVNGFAKDYFIEQLWETDEGNSVALGYFKERGYTEETIKKFNLGYNPEGWENLVKAATENGYKKEYLVQTGLAKQKEDRIYDAYRGRVIFPVHNLSGRVIGFGGRTLKKEKTIPKYINSPESPIYNKSRSLYGLYFSKNEIIKQDNCFLVEGYTDVISLHQAGIENVVSSSGTSLTEEQIRLIKRYSSNVTILYDGDEAGIRASFRGIDMLLEQGMNIKVVLFPEGEDPDSFAHNHSEGEVRTFLEEEARDFIVFKTRQLSKGVENDPVKRAGMIKDVVDSIALIPDHITRSVYVKECSKLLKTEERVLINELNKVRRKRAIDQSRKEKRQAEQQQEAPRDEMPPVDLPGERTLHVDEANVSFQERDVIRLLLNYHGKTVFTTVEDDEGNETEEEMNAGFFIVSELVDDEFEFNDPVYQRILIACKNQLEEHGEVNENYFLQEADQELRDAYVDLVEMKYNLHKWEQTHHIVVRDEGDKLSKAIDSALVALRSKRVMKMIRETEEKLKVAHEQGEDVTDLLKTRQKLDEAKRRLSEPFGIVIR